MGDFHDRLNLIIDGRIPEIRKAINITDQSMRKWATGTFPKANNLADLCEYTDTSPNWLILGEGPRKLSDCKFKDESEQVSGVVLKEGETQDTPKVGLDISRSHASALAETIKAYIMDADYPDSRAIAVVEILKEAFPRLGEWVKKYEREKVYNLVVDRENFSKKQLGKFLGKIED